jgi:lysophospholipase L1-like esterase
MGPSRGTTGSGPPLHLTVIGESPVAGVGVATYEDALAAQLARCLAARLGRTVHWTALGENGADAAGVLARLAPQLEPCDLALLVMGVNDTTHFTRLSTWRDTMRALVAAAGRVCRGPIVVAGVPPMGRFTALPQPLRWWIGLRAAILDVELERAVAGLPRVQFVAVPPLLEPGHLASDGYHPSAGGCAAWAAQLADQIARD